MTASNILIEHKNQNSSWNTNILQIRQKQIDTLEGQKALMGISYLWYTYTYDAMYCRTNQSQPYINCTNDKHDFAVFGGW